MCETVLRCTLQVCGQRPLDAGRRVRWRRATWHLATRRKSGVKIEPGGSCGWRQCLLLMDDRASSVKNTQEEEKHKTSTWLKCLSSMSINWPRRKTKKHVRKIRANATPVNNARPGDFCPHTFTSQCPMFISLQSTVCRVLKTSTFLGAILSGPHPTQSSATQRL